MEFPESKIIMPPTTISWVFNLIIPWLTWFLVIIQGIKKVAFLTRRNGNV